MPERIPQVLAVAYKRDTGTCMIRVNRLFTAVVLTAPRFTITFMFPDSELSCWSVRFWIFMIGLREDEKKSGSSFLPTAFRVLPARIDFIYACLLIGHNIVLWVWISILKKNKIVSIEYLSKITPTDIFSRSRFQNYEL